MANHRYRGGRTVIPFGVAGLLLGAGLVGCGHKDAPTPADGGQAPALAVPGAPAGPSASPYAYLCKSFADATVPDPPEGQILSDTTLTGKSVGKLYEQAVQTWDTIKFVTPAGKSITYTVVLDTELGPIEINLLPEAAPNHVRSFLVLAKIGYYDGLVFERAIHDQSDAVPDSKVELIEGGCPLGCGNPGFGSIGYWLKPELNDQVKHEEGTVGACLGESDDTGACRFYITLSRAPVLDGERTVFGKVTRGLDVARRISTQPVLNAPEFPDGTRPEHPIVIRKATIRTKEVDNPPAKRENP
ncbi:MAG: peptidylprolyl isomerase [Gemmataceae bacterium]|nr:peptidylprolyl isomerase [Gemmataceae bacterium]